LHIQIDKYARRNSIIHKINSHVKFIALFLILIFISLTQNNKVILITLGSIITILAITKIPFKFYLKRIMLCIPFIICILFIPKEQAITLILKATTSILTVIAYTSTTTFSKIKHTLKLFKVPDLFIQMLTFFHRYMFTLTETIAKMKIAKNSRCFNKKQTLHYKPTAKMIGNLLVRSYDQSQRTYHAMLARGFSDPSQEE
jgi:cobalt/nickel transport system permease protein